MEVLPNRDKLFQIIDSNDRQLWEYYGTGVSGTIYSWIFRSRLKKLATFFDFNSVTPKLVLDCGCGSMLTSFVVTQKSNCDYIGVDIVSSKKLRTYRDAMRLMGTNISETVRASVEHLPFRSDVFDVCLSFDVLEHIKHPQKAILDIISLSKNNAMLVISLPLENFFQKFLRLGFTLMRITGHPIFRNFIKKSIPVTTTPEYHYVGVFKTCDEMVNMLKGLLVMVDCHYSPVGIHKSFNINVLHRFLVQKK